MFEIAGNAVAAIWTALGGSPEWLSQLEIGGEGDLPSAFAVSDLAGASVGAACLAMAEFVSAQDGRKARATVDRRLASLWFGRSIRPQGWEIAPSWDAVAGDYETKDGWIKLHTNAPHHRTAALAVLGTPPDRDQVAHAVRRAGSGKPWAPPRRWSGSAKQAHEAGQSSEQQSSAPATAPHSSRSSSSGKGYSTLAACRGSCKAVKCARKGSAAGSTIERPHHGASYESFLPAVWEACSGQLTRLPCSAALCGMPARGVTIR